MPYKTTMNKALRTLVLCLGAVSVHTVAQEAERGLELGQCRQMPSFAERESCLRAHLSLLEIDQEISQLQTGRDTGQRLIMPQPVAYLAGPQMTPGAVVEYQGGHTVVRPGDHLAGGWRVVAINRTTVQLDRGGKTLYLGYGNGEDGKAITRGDYAVPPIPVPLPAPISPRRPPP